MQMLGKVRLCFDIMLGNNRFKIVKEVLKG